jgi:hypothetical protein
MARQITITEERWKELQSKLLDKLKLSKFGCGRDTSLTPEQTMRVAEMHRSFHYQVCVFFDDVEKA